MGALAKRAGARYMVLTARHHDGFALFDSRVSNFLTSVRGAARRDFVREYVEACREAGPRVGLYYSVMSWQHPAIYTGPAGDPRGWAAMVEETHAQVRELMSAYGRIDLLWFDGAVVPGIQDRGIIARFWRSRELNSMIRALQPAVTVATRATEPAIVALDLPRGICAPARLLGGGDALRITAGNVFAPRGGNRLDLAVGCEPSDGGGI